MNKQDGGLDGGGALFTLPRMAPELGAEFSADSGAMAGTVWPSGWPDWVRS